MAAYLAPEFFRHFEASVEAGSVSYTHLVEPICKLIHDQLIAVVQGIFHRLTAHMGPLPYKGNNQKCER